MDWDRVFKRNLNDIKRGARNLKRLGLRIEVHPTETMIGTVANHVYVVDRMGERVCLQKFLFTANG